MTCYHPLRGWESRSPSKEGGRLITFDLREGYADKPMSVPCGQCIGCRLDRSRMWAVRCVHEAQLYDTSYFVTLTYNDAHLPYSSQLVKRDFQLFVKRLRKEIAPERVRYYMCGEYGDLNGRPHYHAIFFGLKLPDLVVVNSSKGVTLYSSSFLERLWPFGFCTVGDVTFESAAYVARYVLKKITGPSSDNHYLDRSTGVIKQCEYNAMSRRPGIGAGWFDKFNGDVFPSDEVIIAGKRVRVPRFYDERLKITNRESYDVIKRARAIVAERYEVDPVQLQTKGIVKQAQLGFLRRSL